jgi:hypothetical protein
LAIRDRFTTDAPIAAGADRVAIAAITATAANRGRACAIRERCTTGAAIAAGADRVAIAAIAAIAANRGREYAKRDRCTTGAAITADAATGGGCTAITSSAACGVTRRVLSRTARAAGAAGREGAAIATDSR